MPLSEQVEIDCVLKRSVIAPFERVDLLLLELVLLELDIARYEGGCRCELIFLVRFDALGLLLRHIVFSCVLPDCIAD